MTREELRLQGQVTSLREFRETSDVDAVEAIIGDDRVTVNLSFDSRSRSDAVKMLVGVVERRSQDPRSEYYLAVTPGHSDECVGFVRLALDGVRAGKLGYAVAYPYWGHGYASDATETMTRFGFDMLNLHRISAAIGPGNAASVAIARRLGMSHEGRIRDHVFTNNAWRDSDLYSVLSHEWSGVGPD